MVKIKVSSGCTFPRHAVDGGSPNSQKSNPVPADSQSWAWTCFWAAMQNAGDLMHFCGETLHIGINGPSPLPYHLHWADVLVVWYSYIVSARCFAQRSEFRQGDSTLQSSGSCTLNISKPNTLISGQYRCWLGLSLNAAVLWALLENYVDRDNLALTLREAFKCKSWVTLLSF